MNSNWGLPQRAKALAATSGSGAVAEGIDLAATDRQHVIENLVGNVHTRGGNTVAKFDGVIDFVHEEPALGVFQERPRP